MKLVAQKNRTFLTACAAPVLLALAASAYTSSDAKNPTPSPADGESGGAAPPTLYPNPTIGYKTTPSPAEEGVGAAEEEEEGTPVTETEEEYEEEEGGSSMTGSDGGNSTTTGGEEAPAGFGGTCTTYDEDVSIFGSAWFLLSVWYMGGVCLRSLLICFIRVDYALSLSQLTKKILCIVPM